jgi:hypothetical protein
MSSSKPGYPKWRVVRGMRYAPCWPHLAPPLLVRAKRGKEREDVGVEREMAGHCTAPGRRGAGAAASRGRRERSRGRALGSASAPAREELRRLRSSEPREERSQIRILRAGLPLFLPPPPGACPARRGRRKQGRRRRRRGARVYRGEGLRRRGFAGEGRGRAGRASTRAAGAPRAPRRRGRFDPPVLGLQRARLRPPPPEPGPASSALGRERRSRSG